MTTTIKEGFVTKEGLKVQSWRRRWLVLSTNSLSYYTAENKRTKKGGFKLSVVESADTVRGEYKNRQFVFFVCCTGRTYYVQTASEEERTDWINSINTAIGKPTIGPPPPKYIPQGPENGSSSTVASPTRLTISAKSGDDDDDDDDEDDDE